MNIVVQPYRSEHCYCRPDTTWERENKDFYSPECVNELMWAPIVFVRISKAGKCIGRKFASRYYDAFNFGALMYIGDYLPCLATSSCCDHTSILPSPLYNNIVMEGEGNEFIVERNDAVIFKTGCSGELKETIEEALCRASVLTSLRIGDFVAVELAPVAPLAKRNAEETSVKAVFCENPLFETAIRF